MVSAGGHSIVLLSAVCVCERFNNSALMYLHLPIVACPVAMGGGDLSATPLSDLPASSTATPITSDPLPVEAGKTTPKKNRCFSCRKKVGLTGACVTHVQYVHSCWAVHCACAPVKPFTHTHTAVFGTSLWWLLSPASALTRHSLCPLTLTHSEDIKHFTLLFTSGFHCRCGNQFCALHRYADKHDCPFDYKAAGREELERKHPRIVADKVQKL